MSNRLENNKVAARYAKALFESTVESGEANQVAADLLSMSSLFEQVPTLLSFLENPGVSQDEKLQLIQGQIAQSVSPWVGRLLKLLIENNRAAILPQLAEHFVKLLNQRENTAQAEVVSATELEDELRSRIRKTLEETFGFSRVDLQNRVDPGLLGGVIVKIQDQIIDGSYVGRLEELRKQISKL